MTFITRTASALAILGSVFVSTAAFAITPFDAATFAYRGQLDGIPGYQPLQTGLRTGNITGEDILEAAGLEANSTDANFVESILRDNNNNN